MARVNLWKPEPKRRTGIVRAPVVPGVSLTKYTNHELGIRIARRSNAPRQEPGIAWARLMRSANRPDKDAARAAVLERMTVEQFPSLKVLTFPASEWRFERALLAQRGEPENRGPSRTQIYAIERDIAVYRAACHNIPIGGGDKRRGAVRTPETPAFASAHVQTAKVNGFFCCTFEDYVGAGTREVYHAAWLDFMGKLTPSRLDAITRFWNRQLGGLLVVTLYNGRTCDWINGLIRGAGNVEALLASRCVGSVVEDVLHYGDGAPMVQVTLRRVSGRPLALDGVA